MCPGRGELTLATRLGPHPGCPSRRGALPPWQLLSDLSDDTALSSNVSSLPLADDHWRPFPGGRNRPWLAPCCSTALTRSPCILEGRFLSSSDGFNAKLSERTRVARRGGVLSDLPVGDGDGDGDGGGDENDALVSCFRGAGFGMDDTVSLRVVAPATRARDTYSAATDVDSAGSDVDGDASI